MSVLQVVLPLQVSNDSCDVRSVRAPVRSNGNCPARPVVAVDTRSNNGPAVHIRDLALQVRDSLNSLQNHLSQLFCRAGGFGHVQAPV